MVRDWTVQPGDRIWRTSLNLMSLHRNRKLPISNLALVAASSISRSSGWRGSLAFWLYFLGTTSFAPRFGAAEPAVSSRLPHIALLFHRERIETLAERRLIDRRSHSLVCLAYLAGSRGLAAPAGAARSYLDGGVQVATGLDAEF